MDFLQNSSYKKGVSVVIVTYNGSTRIVPTLQYLANQKNIDFDWEVLIVNNNSTDDTNEVIHNFCEVNQHPFTLRIVTELVPGTMFARKKGIEESYFRYVLYCDDDNWLNENYVKTAYDTISNNYEIAAVGGMGIMEYEPGFIPPSWIVAYERNYGTTPQGKSDGDTTNDKGCLYTAGAIIDKCWLDKLYSLGFKSSLKGRDGKSLVAGEDTELTYALKLIGGKLYYSSKMNFKHFMPSERINLKYLKKLWNSFGYSDYIISPYYDFFSNKKDEKQMFKLVHNLKRLVLLYINKIKYRNEQVIRETLLIERCKGELKAIIFSNKIYEANKVIIQELNSKVKK